MVWTYFCRDGYANNVGGNSRKKLVNYYIAPILIYGLWITKAAKLRISFREIKGERGLEGMVEAESNRNVK